MLRTVLPCPVSVCILHIYIFSVVLLLGSAYPSKATATLRATLPCPVSVLLNFLKKKLFSVVLYLGQLT